MELIKDNWSESDILEFQNYLITFENKSKQEWSSSILKTTMPVLAIKTKDMKAIMSAIAKGNFTSFLDYMVWEYYENTAINGYLVCLIKDFDTMKKYLDKYSVKADNWATCDLLTFDCINNEKRFFDLALAYVKNDKPFVRRIGVNILFKFIEDSDYVHRIFELLNSFITEENYYVNMINAWLICECFIKQREKTIQFLNNHKLNRFTINKAIQKCRESNRVSKEDKQMLLKYKM